MTLEIVDKLDYTVTVFFIEDEEGNTYKVTHSDDFDDEFVQEWEFVDEDEEKVTDTTLLDNLKSLCVKKLNDK